MSDEWKEQGACFGSADPRFFPERGDRNKAAKAICFDLCPVREECLEHALSRPEKWGIWGGTSERERQAIRKRRNADARVRMKHAKATP